MSSSRAVRRISTQWKVPISLHSASDSSDDQLQSDQLLMLNEEDDSFELQRINEEECEFDDDEINK
jgi:hypothetical protein